MGAEAIFETLGTQPQHWLALSAVLFSISLYGLLTRRNAIGILISLEAALNSAALNFVIFNRFLGKPVLDGQVMAMFIIAVAAAEAVVAIAIFVTLYRQRRTVDVNHVNLMRL